MTDTKVKKAADKANYLDTQTQDLLNSVRKKNNKAVTWFVVCFLVLFTVGIGGIWRQNQLAEQNKAHIDCIIKDLATPIPPGAKNRVITHPQSFCGIIFTK